MIRKFFTFFVLFIGILSANAQPVKIQFINNSADDSLSFIDIYINGNPGIANLAYHEASIFFQVNLGVQPISIGIAKSGGTITDTFYNLTTTLPSSPTNEYIIVANGIKSPTGYSPKKPFGLSVFSSAMETAPIGNTAFLFMHGSTDAVSQIDFRSGITNFGDVGYGQFTGSYISLPTNDFTLRTTNSLGSKILGNYTVPVGTAAGYSGKATIIVSSGFVVPANNKNGDPYGLWMAPPNGGSLIHLGTTVPEALARVQLINNSADTSVDTIDIYVNGVKTIDNLPFRNATKFEDAFAKTPTDIVISRQNSTAVTDDTLVYSTIVFDSAKAYTIVMNGIDTPTTGYTPLIPLSIKSYNDARESAANAANTDILIMNGSTDIPSLNINVNSTPIASGLGYNNFTSSYYSTPTADIVLDVSGASPINKYSANLQTLNLQGEAVTILSSGFRDSLHNRRGPALGMYMTMPGGGPLTKLPINTGVSKLDTHTALSIWPNPASSTLYLDGKVSFDKARVTIYDISGRVVLQLNDISNKQIDVSSLANGSYIIRINDGTNSMHHHFIKD